MLASTLVDRNQAAARRALALHRQVILPVAALLALAAVVLGTLMVLNAAREDAKSRAASVEIMRAGIDARIEQLDRVVKDYAWWNETVEAVQLRRDADWAKTRLGYYLTGTHG